MRFWSCITGGKLYTTDVKESTINCKLNICPSDKNYSCKTLQNTKIKKKMFLNQSPKSSTRLMYLFCFVQLRRQYFELDRFEMT